MTTTSVTTSTTSVFTETSGNKLLVASGGNVTSAIIQSGGQLVVSGGVDAGATISSGGTETVSAGSVSGDQIFGSLTITGTSAVATNETVFNGGVVDLYKGAMTGTTVTSGGKLLISGGNTATDTVLSGGGTIELATSGATLAGALTFTGGSNELVLDKVLSAATTSGVTIAGFSSTDQIVVSGATAVAISSSGGNTIATVSGGGVTDTLTFSGAQYNGNTLSWVASNGAEVLEYTPSVSSSGPTTTSVTTSTAPGTYTETSGNTLLVLSGGSVSAATINSGGFLTISGGADFAATISAGGTETVDLGSASSDKIFGTVSTLSGGAGVFTSETVENGGVFNLLNGNSADGTTVLSGGLFVLSGNNGAVTNTVLSGGGTVELDSPKANISGSLTFAGGGNTLDVAVVASAPTSSASYGDLAAISGFSSTDKIDVTALGTGAKLSFASSGGNEDVTVTGTGVSETFIFSGTTTYTSATLGLVSSGGLEYVEYSAGGVMSSGGATTTSVTTSTAPGAFTETSGNTLLVLNGGSVSAATVDSGAFLTVSGGAEVAATVLSGGIETVLAGSASGDMIFGTISTMSNGTGVFSNETVEKGGVFNLLNGNIADGTTVLSGGELFISGKNGALTNTVVSGGGTVVMASPKASISGSLTFEGGGNLLEFTDITSAGFGVSATISGFSASDKIDITSAAYPAATLTLSQTVSGGNTIVEVLSGGTAVETFTFAGTALNGELSLQSDGNGGADLEIAQMNVTTSVTTSTASGAFTETATNTLLVLGGGSVSAATINAGGHLVVNGGTDVAASVSSGGTETVSAGTASGDQIQGSATVAGGTVSGETVLGGGLLTVDGGAVSNIALGGNGTLDLATTLATVSGAITFSGGGNKLEAGAIANAGAGDQAVISGFSTADKIDVTGINPTGATLSFATNGAGNEVVTVTGTGGSESFVFNDPSAYNANTMSLTKDGSGGVDLLLDTTPVVNFTSLSGLQTNQATYILNGTVDTTADPEAIGTTVSVTEGNTVVGTGKVGANGYWSAAVTFLNDDGANVLTASDTDSAGNTGVTAKSLTYNVNTTAAAFTPGNLVVSISGDGDGSGSYGDNQGSALTLEQITTSGTIVSQLVLPQTTTVVNGVTENVVSAEYGSSSEGALQLSADGHSLVIAGYGVNAQTYNAGGAAVYGNAALAQTTSIQGGPFTAVSRVIADINADGTVDSSTALYNVFDQQNPRSVATVNGSSFYVSGQGDKGSTNQGVFYAADGASSATVINDATDTRFATIYNGQLYVSADSTQGATNISDYGALPTGATQPMVLTGLSTSVALNGSNGNTVNAGLKTSVNLSPESFFFANPNTLYVADGGDPKAGGLGDGGLQKWTYNGTQWTLQYTLSAGLNLVPDTASSGTTGLIGLTGTVNGDSVELFATNSTLTDTGQTYVYAITDSLSSTTGAGESFNTIMTASPDENIRGISFAPTTPAPTIAGTVAGQTTTSDAPVTPFSAVTIADTNSNAVDTLTITVGGSGGTLADGAGFSGLTVGGAAGVFTLTGTADAITKELDALVFTPTGGAPNTSLTSTFTLSDLSSANATPTVDSTTSVIDRDPAVAPIISQAAGTTAAGSQTPFFGFSIVDPNSGTTDTLSIQVSSGTLADGVGFSGLQAGAPGVYTLKGTASAITAELDALVFQPASSNTTSVPTTINLTDTTTANTSASTSLSVVGLGNGDSSVPLNGSGNEVIGGNGNNTITGGAGNNSVNVGNGKNTLTLSGTGNDVTAGNGFNYVTASGGATITLGNGNNKVQTAGLNNVINVGSGTNSITSFSGSTTVNANGGHDTVSLTGTGNQMNIFGSAVANISEHGSGLQVDVGSSTQVDTLSGLGGDASWLLDFTNGAGGFGSVGSVMNALQSDGHGGTSLSLGSTGSIDFVNLAQNQIHASNFKIGTGLA